MRGGAVFVASGNYQLTADPQSGGLAMLPITDGLQDMLGSYGVTVQPKLVVDPQNSAFPVQTNRNAGNGLSVNEIQAVPYAFFPDVRQNEMDQSSPVVGRLPSITVNWASPITLDDGKLKPFKVSKLLQSSPNSGVTTSTNLEPTMTRYPDTAFPLEGP